MGSLRTNQSFLRKHGWTFIYSHCFQRVTCRKKYSDDSVKEELYIIIFRDIIEKYREFYSYLSCVRK